MIGLSIDNGKLKLVRVPEKIWVWARHCNWARLGIGCEPYVDTSHQSVNGLILYIYVTWFKKRRR